MAHIAQDIVIQKAQQVRLLALDVDGVLTDGTIVYTSEGSQVQFFHVQDGFGLKLLRDAGVNTAIISSRSSEALIKRATELRISKVVQGAGDKAASLGTLMTEFGVTLEQIAYVGDDWVDLPILLKVGLAVVVADATPPLSDYAHYVTTRPGGRGAVREVCDLILRAQNRWSDYLNRYLGP